MPESTDFKGLFDTDISIQEAQTANTASVSRWTQFRQDFTALKPDAAAFEATREGQKALNESYKANITQFVDNFSSARLSQMNTQELMTVYTGLRDINAFDDMARLYNNSADAGFKNAPVVREFLAVSYNKTGRPADAIKVAEGLVEAGHANGEVYGALGKAYQLQRQAADGLADAMDSGDASRLARAETTYRSALNLPEGQSLPNSSALRNQAQSIVESSRSAYHKGFTNTFDFYPGINAAYGDLAAGDYASAVKTAELTHLAALRDGGLQTTDYWRTSTMLESSIISGGDEASIKRALATLVSYKDVPEWQWRSTTEALNDRVKPALEKVIAAGDGQSAEQARQALHHIEDVTKTLEKRIADPSFRVISGPVAFNDAANPMTRLVQEKSFSYRGMSTWDAQMVNGNMRFGGAIADHMVTQRDRAEFAKLLDQPVDDLMRKLGGNPAELPQAARGKTLNQIDDVNTFLETSQKITRANFSTETRGLEVIDGVSHHTQFDAPVEGINRLAGVPDNPGALRNFDSRTSLSAEFGKGLGDCRHHAQAQQLMFDEWQRGKMNQALFAAHNAQTAETRAAAIGRFENLRNTELRTFDVEVYAPIKIEDAYKPIRPDVGIEGRMAGETFIASKDMARVEDHTMNMLVRYDKTGNVESARFADAFYQNTYKWGNGEVDIVNVKNIDGSLALSAGKLEGVAGANGNAVDVLIKPTPYAGNRRALAHGDVGAVWERGTPYGQYDLVQAIEQRPVANSNIAKATTELPKLKLSGDDVHKQLVTMLDGKDLPATARRPDMRLIVRNSGAEDIQFKNPGGHAAALERIPPNEAAMVMLKGNTLEAQQLNAAKLDKLYSLSEKGMSPQFLDDLKSGNLSDYIAEAYGPAPLEAQAKRLETTRWVNADGTNIDINPVKGENAAYGVRPASKEQVFMVKLDGDAPATLQGTGTSAERFYKGADGNNYIAVAVAKDGATGEIRTRPIAPDVAKQYYGDGFKDIPVLEMDKTGKVSSIDTAPHIKTVSQNAELKAASIAESKPKLYSASELDFGGGKPVISSAQKFILPVPDLKGNGEPLVYPAGHEKAGQSITDWQGKKIGDDGIVFFNHADKSVQAVPSDGKGVIIMNQVTEDQARLLNAKIESMGGPEKLSRSQIKEVLEYAQKDLSLGDMYNSDVNFIKSKMSPIGGTGNFKGVLAEAAYRHFNRLPDSRTQELLKQKGWNFTTTHGMPSEYGADVVNRVIHPDGKPLDGEGSPGYVSGCDGPIILKNRRESHEGRWCDFRKAVSQAKSCP